MLGVLPFGEDPDLSRTAGTAVPQHLPPCCEIMLLLLYNEFNGTTGLFYINSLILLIKYYAYFFLLKAFITSLII